MLLLEHLPCLHRTPSRRSEAAHLLGIVRATHAAPLPVPVCTQIVRDLAQETREQRERAAHQRKSSEQQAKGKVDRLKEAFIAKQLEKQRQQAQGKLARQQRAGARCGEGE